MGERETVRGGGERIGGGGDDGEGVGGERSGDEGGDKVGGGGGEVGADELNVDGDGEREREERGDPVGGGGERDREGGFEVGREDVEGVVGAVGVKAELLS